MKSISIFLFFFSSMSIAAQELNVMSFNIRYNNPGDSLDAWPYRKDKVSSQVLYYEAHVLGVQEALHGQLEDMQQRLPKYKYARSGP